MASKKDCAYCFEVLASSFTKTQPLSLTQVEELWDQYQARNTQAGAQQDEDDGGEEEEDDDDDIDGADADMTDAEAIEPTSARPAAISRLLRRGDAASSSSSLQSSNRSTTPSTPSSRESETSLDTPASSQSSLPLSRHRAREHYPLFVTWNTNSKSGHKSLRGCIGTFEAQELEHGLRSYALTSAFEDVRFAPIPSSLLPSLSCHVTLLTNFSQPTRDPMEWTLGKHGLRISFTVHGRRYGATYLPDVAREQGWTKEETLVSLMRKAGWNGSSSSWLKTWREGKGEIVRYEGKAVGLHYGEWREWRDWVDKVGAKAKAAR